MDKNYKFKDLKIYGSAEWMAGKSKRYRRVYDRAETSYIYAELSFFNKKFDNEDWDVSVILKAYSIKGTKKVELCSLDVSRRVSKEENIVYVREGWGNKKQGVYWKSGEYVWEAMIEGEVVASAPFHIEEIGMVTKDTNPYFSIESIKLYESGDLGVPKEDRVYLKKFDAKETRFVFAEFTFKNLLHPDPWNAEITFNFFNSARQLKGKTVELKKITENDNTFTITSGWGSDSKGSWFLDSYTMEIVFMNTLIAVLPFEVTDANEEGMSEAFLPNTGVKITRKPIEHEQSLEEVMLNLESLVGLASIKKKVKEYAEYLRFIKLRIDKGFDDNSSIQMHAIFTGNPGTGKTTVAKKLGSIYNKMGLLTKGHVHEVDRSDLVGEYIGQTAPKVKEALKKARGGILFVDEAYSLARSLDDSKDFGREVIEILLKEMSDGVGDISIIFAGYPSEMRTFLDANSGMKSRLNLWFDFPDYLPQELADIAEFAAEERNVELTPQGKAYLYDKIVEAYRTRDRFFGNARFVNQLVEKAKMNLGLRVMKTEDPYKLNQKELSVITVEDIENIFTSQKRELPDIPVEEEMLQAALKELDSLIGLDSLKKDVRELIKLVRFNKEMGKEVLNNFSLHTVFVGNPGTGKTTVARIIAKIYKALGVLERGHLVEVDRQNLIAGFVGQTALKTTKKLDEAEGGILFIDEAYALVQRGANDFGNEAIETILKRMEDKNGHFAVVVAGYPAPMKQFIESNPGLKSRFDRTFKFEDFEVKELIKIASAMLKKRGYKIEKKALTQLDTYFNFLYRRKDQYFGNGRMVRTTIHEVIKNQNLRLAEIPKEKRTPAAMKTIKFDDVVMFNEKRGIDYSGRKKVGFNYNNKKEEPKPQRATDA